MNEVFQKVLPQIYDIDNLRKLTGRPNLSYEEDKGFTYNWDVGSNYAESYYADGEDRGKIYYRVLETEIQLITTKGFSRSGTIFPETIHVFTAYRPSEKVSKPERNRMKSFNEINHYGELRGAIGDFIDECPNENWGGDTNDNHKNLFRFK